MVYRNFRRYTNASAPAPSSTPAPAPTPDPGYHYTGWRVANNVATSLGIALVIGIFVHGWPYHQKSIRIVNDDDDDAAENKESKN
jgi:hypothetical protein